MEMSALAEKSVLIGKLEVLNKEYYNEMLTTVDKINSYIDTISLRPTEDVKAIINACKEVTAEMKAYVTERQQEFFSYTDQLIDKRINSHDCKNCSGSCKLQHRERLSFFEISYAKMVSVFKENLAVFENAAETIFPNIVRLLQNQLILLESFLTEAFFYETTQIKPLIYKMQQAIGAA